MPVHQQSSKLSKTLGKRMGRALTSHEILRLVAYARAIRFRRDQQRIYKPRMELWDDGDSQLVTAMFELPGLRRENIAVDVVNGWLIVSGERRQVLLHETSATPENGGVQTTDSASALAPPDRLPVRELKYGFFRRVVAVPAGCTTSDLEATMENGMLIVTWPRDPYEHFEKENTGSP